MRAHSGKEYPNVRNAHATAEARVPAKGRCRLSQLCEERYDGNFVLQFFAFRPMRFSTTWRESVLDPRSAQPSMINSSSSLTRSN
eukprot:3679722-Alexandrium_andersonii.AAC.1